MTGSKIKILKEKDKIKELGEKICKFVEYYERKDEYSHVLQLAALANILLSIREIFKNYDERFKDLEKYKLEHHGINETGGINNIKIILDDPILKKEKRII